MGTKKILILIILIPVLFWGGCEKKVTYAEHEPTPVPTLTRTSTAVIYNPYAPKNDLSLLLFMTESNDQCKNFISQTLTDTAVVRLINESFNIARIDPLSDIMVSYYNTPMTGSHMATNIYNITNLPTTCVLNKNGEYITRWTGFIMPEEYADNLKYAREHY